MISGYGPSGPLTGSGGNATRTSIGTPSKVLTVLRAVPPGFPAIVWSQRRTPLPCTAQGIGAGVPEKTLVIAAFAVGANASSTTLTASASNAGADLRSCVVAGAMPLLSRWIDEPPAPRAGPGAART